MDLNFSLAKVGSEAQNLNFLKLSLASQTDTNISRVLAFPFSDSLVLFLPRLTEETTKTCECVCACGFAC